MNLNLFDGQFKYSPYVPFDPFSNPLLMGYITTPTLGGVQPFEYSGWRNEMLSWHDGCYIHAGLNPDSEGKVTGKDVIPFLAYNLTNGFTKFPVGKIKHGIMVSEQGNIVIDGILQRNSEDEFEFSNLGNYLEYRASQQDFDVKIEDMTGNTFLYQLGGPRSLEVVEAACREDLHDIKFLQHRAAKIAGRSVEIRRVGMAGSLAYEVAGAFEDCLPVYECILEAGQAYGITQLGRHAYWNTHTENGFPQGVVHFPFAWEQDEGYFKFMQETHSPLIHMAASNSSLVGSLGSEIEARYVNPFELNWGGSVAFNHEFIGREALESIKEKGTRKVCTLEWNPEDIVDVWRSGLVDDNPYAPIDGPEDFDARGRYEYRADWVLAGGKRIGISSGRIHSWYYKKMLSLGFIDPAYAEEGTELKFVWGSPDERQKEIRCKVARYPYMNDGRNEVLDVESIPHPVF